MKVVTRQQFGPPLLKPLLGPPALALGAGPVPAAMIEPKRFVTVIASVPPPAQGDGAAGLNVRKGLLL